jgi:predicted TIM-barrel fold metal-dependent hydrolase
MTTDGSEKVLIVSVDGHVSARMADYRQYLESRFQADFDDFLPRYEASRGGSRIVQPMELFGKGSTRTARYQTYMIESGAIDGEFDIERRLKEVGQQGVAAEVVFPNEIPFTISQFGFSAPEESDPELIEAGQRAYNRWVADFVSQSPDRLIGQAQVSFRDVDEAVKTVEWGREHGLRGVVLPGIEPGLPRLHWDPALDPFWSAMEDTGMVANVHGVNSFQAFKMSDLPAGVDMNTALRVGSMEFPMHSHRPLTFMMWSGVFERHPRLKIAWTEQFSDWIPRVLSMWDWTWNKDVKWGRITLPRSPSEYWAQSCWAGMSLCSRAEVESRHLIGIDKVMFGVDFPHVESTYPITLHQLQALGKGVPEDELRKFLGLNAAALWDLDVAALLPVVEEVGFTMAELRSPVPPDVVLNDDIGRPLAST